MYDIPPLPSQPAGPARFHTGDDASSRTTTRGITHCRSLFRQQLVPDQHRPGTGQLAGISGTADLDIDPDGTHRIWLDYEIAG